MAGDGASDGHEPAHRRPGPAPTVYDGAAASAPPVAWTGTATERPSSAVTSAPAAATAACRGSHDAHPLPAPTAHTSCPNPEPSSHRREGPSGARSGAAAWSRRCEGPRAAAPDALRSAAVKVDGGRRRSDLAQGGGRTPRKRRRRGTAGMWSGGGRTTTRSCRCCWRPSTPDRRSSWARPSPSRSPATRCSWPTPAWDLQAYSGGRFILGLGSQIKPHITKRFSMPWSHPAPRMRELVLAVRAIWDCWLNGTKLEFRGEFYTHTLIDAVLRALTASDLAEVGRAPSVFLAGVGELMTEVAGEVCDGFICHGFSDGAVPARGDAAGAAATGRAKAGQDPGGVRDRRRRASW